MSRYRITFAIERSTDDFNDDVEEIGFGSSMSWQDLDACTHDISSGIANGEWETSGDMPDPDDVMAEIGDQR